MCQASVDDRLAQLLGLYNVEKAFSDGLRLRYQRLRSPIPGKFVCTSVHSDSEDGRATLYPFLRRRLSWTDNAEVSIDDVMFFVVFLKGTLSGESLVASVGRDIAEPGSLHAADADHVPKVAGAWR